MTLRLFFSQLLLAATLVASPVLLAQDEYLDYNDEEAAGPVNYDDEVAAGPADEASEAPPVADEQVDETPSAAAETTVTGEATVSTGELTGDAAVAAETSSRDDKLPWEMGATRHHSSSGGSAGLMDIIEAGSSSPGTFALGVQGGFFKYTDYLISGDTNTQAYGNVNLRVVPFKFLEIHGALKGFANANDKEQPDLFQTIGNFDIGLKGFFSPVKLLTLGLDVDVAFRNSVGNVGIDTSGTSVGLNGLATFDLANLDRALPLRAHLMAGYIFDNSANVIEDTELARGGCGTDLDNDGLVEYTGCLSPVERTALNINRNDQVHVGVGLDALLPYVSPIAEYHIDIPVNRQNFTCPDDPNSYDHCMAKETVHGMRQWLNLGVRILPPIKDLAIDLGAEIGLSGYAPTVHELAAQEPYVVKMGVSYQFSPFAKPAVCEPETVEKVVTVQTPAEPAASAPVQVAVIAGMVHDSTSKDKPVKGATIVYKGLNFNPQVTSQAGRFNSYDLPVKPVTITISAPGYVEQNFVIDIKESGIMEQFFGLEAAPQKGVVTVTVENEKGKPVKGVEVGASGNVSDTFTTDDNGQFRFEADAGTVQIKLSNEGYLYKVQEVSVMADEHSKVTMTVREKPKKSLVIMKQDQIKIKKKIHFKVNSDEISLNSHALLDEVADIILKNEQVKKIEIQGHTDNKGSRDHNLELSEKRASAVMRYLISAGVDANRLSAAGFGPDKPVAPNVTRTGRARNRRVEFHILAQQ